MSLGQSSTVRAVPGSSALRKVCKFGTVASHQDRLPAYRSGAPVEIRSGKGELRSRMAHANRCFRTRKIMRMRGAHKGDGAGMQFVVREISHLYPAIFQKSAPTFFAPVRPIYPRAVNRSNYVDFAARQTRLTASRNAVYSHCRLFGGRPRWPRMAFS